MKVLLVRNVQQALVDGIHLLKEHGIERPSRNGPVLQAPWPVTTVYERPLERVLFWPQRDANPFFHLAESLWMIAGRNDVAFPARYAKQILEYSDDGVTLHGAYGKRWRSHFGYDQLDHIAFDLTKNSEDRRCILQMWDANVDGNCYGNGKDYPCNTLATFQRDAEGKLNLVVFCRSNDIIWGAYGANAVHFSMLLEYMALWIGCPVGTYTQISVNFHAYLDTLKTLDTLPKSEEGFYAQDSYKNPYAAYKVRPVPMFHGSIESLDIEIKQLLLDADTDFQLLQCPHCYDEPFIDVAFKMLLAHHMWRTSPAPERYAKALGMLKTADQSVDWIVAGTEWLRRRQAKWEAKLERKD